VHSCCRHINININYVEDVADFEYTHDDENINEEYPEGLLGAY